MRSATYRGFIGADDHCYHVELDNPTKMSLITGSSIPSPLPCVLHFPHSLISWCLLAYQTLDHAQTQLMAP